MKNKFLDRLSSPLDRIEGAIFFFVLSPLFVIYALKYTPEGQQPVVRVAMAVLVFLLLRRLIKTLDAQAREYGSLTTAARNGRNALFALAVLGGGDGYNAGVCAHRHGRLAIMEYCWNDFRNSCGVCLYLLLV